MMLVRNVNDTDIICPYSNLICLRELRSYPYPSLDTQYPIFIRIRIFNFRYLRY
jgi:hypothetical protein